MGRYNISEMQKKSNYLEQNYDNWISFEKHLSKNKIKEKHWMMLNITAVYPCQSA